MDKMKIAAFSVTLLSLFIYADGYLNIGERSMPDEETHRMEMFRRGLSETDRKILEEHKSKTRYIQALLDDEISVNRRDIDDMQEVDKRMPEKKESHLQLDPDLEKYLSQLPADQQALIEKHPSQAEHIVAAFHESEKQGSDDNAKKRTMDEQITDSEKVHKNDNANKQNIFQKLLPHISAMKDIIEQAAHDTTGDIGKVNADSEEITEKIISDINEAKNHGIQLQDLLKKVQDKNKQN